MLKCNERNRKQGPLDRLKRWLERSPGLEVREYLFYIDKEKASDWPTKIFFFPEVAEIYKDHILI